MIWLPGNRVDKHHGYDDHARDGAEQEHEASEHALHGRFPEHAGQSQRRPCGPLRSSQPRIIAAPCAPMYCSSKTSAPVQVPLSQVRVTSVPRGGGPSGLSARIDMPITATWIGQRQT